LRSTSALTNLRTLIIFLRSKLISHLHYTEKKSTFHFRIILFDFYNCKFYLSQSFDCKNQLFMTQTKKSIVFCHGIWADGSCFNKVIPTLQAEGFEVISAQYSLDTNENDVATVKRTLGRVSNPAILVGHSYGGSVITAAGTDERVAGLVYIAALAPDAGETSQSQIDQFPTTDVFSHIEVADGRIWMLRDGVACFAGDLSEEEQAVVWATHFAPAADLFTKNAAGTAWKSKPSWYIVAKNDRTVHPELERFVAKRMGATTYEVDSSHVPMLSHPKLVIDVIRDAANAQPTASGQPGLSSR
jgi:pimeloyl-ACP methyl ester carboxylesterase